MLSANGIIETIRGFITAFLLKEKYRDSIPEEKFKPVIILSQTKLAGNAVDVCITANPNGLLLQLEESNFDLNSIQSISVSPDFRFSLYKSLYRILCVNIIFIEFKFE